MKNCLVVLGMHRSGTSAFTGVLELLGVNLGTRMLETQYDNPKGFFENKYVVEANDYIFECLRSGWDDLLPLPGDWTTRFDDSQLHSDIRKFLTTDMVDGQLTALKDPRMSRLLPIWLPHFREEGVSPHIAIVIRNPLEIAESLSSRNGFSRQKSLLLWLLYMLDAEEHSRHLPRGFVHFDQLLEDPRGTVSATFAQAALNAPDFAEIDEAALEKFLDRNMRHHELPDSDIEALCPTLVARYYRLLCAIAERGSPNEEDLAEIDTIRAEFIEEIGLYYNPDVVNAARQIGGLTEPEWYTRELKQLRSNFERDKIYREYRYIANTDFIHRELEQQRHIAKDRQAVAEHLEHEIQQFVGSPPWRVYKKYQETVERLLPQGSAPRRALQQLKQLLLRTPAEPEPAAPVVEEAALEEQPQADKGEEIPRETPEPEALNFPTCDAPDISIIIPVFNNWHFTQKCLHSVLEHTQGNYEVIVVDNHSTDETPERLAAMGGLHVITNAENEVFVNACNQAAEVARGEYILLLNNDTEVTAGWLQAMLAPFDNPRTGVVGAKLVYPDGSLQEAGGIIWRDATGCNYGHGDDPELPRYNYRRNVDYCSGAALMIPARLWREIGGFDTRYAPAYYEDTDLCFTVRSLKYDVVYEPKAVVVHYGGASAGKETSSGYKRFQDINREKFLEKWQSVLETDHVLSEVGTLLSRERMGQKQILIIDHYVPTFDRDSGSQRMISMLQILRDMGYKVTFWPDDRSTDVRYTHILQDLGVEVWYGDTTFEDYIAEFGKHLDAVLMSRPATAKKYLHLVQRWSDAQTIFDTVDLHFVREQRRLELEVSNWRNLEFFLAEETDSTLVVSPTELDLLSTETFADKVAVVSNIHSLEPCETRFEERSGLMFIGGFAHPPNEEGVIWFIEYVLPQVRKKIPDIHLTIVGANPTERILELADKNITVTGYVEDVADIFNTSRVFVSPLLHGAGVKGKIGQSFSFGLPVVTTSIGAEGMYLEDGHNALISDSETEFAAKVVEVYNDAFLWQKLSTNARQVITEQFSPITIRGALEKVLTGKKRKSGRAILLHCHLFKNAGTTLDHCLARNFGDSFIDHRDDHAMRRGAEFLGPYLEEHAGITALSSHHVQFPLPESNAFELLPIIALRHPIERARSVYEFERRQEADTIGAIKAKELDFADYVRWRMLPDTAPTIRNFHCAWCVSVTDAPIGEVEYLQAVAELTRTPGLVIVERYDEAMVLLEHVLAPYYPGIDLAYTAQNVTPGPRGELQARIDAIYEELGPELTHEFREKNHWDVQLYENATAIFNERIGQLGSLDERLANFRTRCQLLTKG